MAIRYLLVHLDKGEASAVRADVGIGLAKRLGARLTALYAVRDPDVPGVNSQNRYMFVERAAGKAHAALQQHAAVSGVTVEWQADIGAKDIEVSRAVIMRSRETDLVILGQYNPANPEADVPEALVEQTVLHSGRPVLVIPYSGRFAQLGRRPVIAWNASREASRALHDALPLLELAEEAIVLALTPAPARGAAGKPVALDGVLNHLKEHGVRATGDSLLFDPSSIEPAERLLSYLADSGADLLVMGAAGQQLGKSAAKRSLTGKVLEQMTVPLLLSY